MDRFQAMLAPTQPVEFVRLTECHRGIPDVEVLRQVLGPDTILLTNDRVLHNQACEPGQALCRLLKGLAAVQLPPCAKGPFRDRMDRKLAQLARSPSNELVTVPFAQIITALNNQSRPGAVGRTFP
jgi:hypothetical protein